VAGEMTECTARAEDGSRNKGQAGATVLLDADTHLTVVIYRELLFDGCHYYFSDLRNAITANLFRHWALFFFRPLRICPVKRSYADALTLASVTLSQGFK
jgi:hypothetical protein